MSATALLITAIIFFTLAAGLFVAAVIMFFVMDIRGIIGDLSGRTLAKGIQDIRNESANANSRSAKAAHRRNNPSKQFSIGNEYSKEKGYTVSSLAHASRRLDIKTQRGEKYPPKTSRPGGTSAPLTMPPNTSSVFAGGNAARNNVKPIEQPPAQQPKSQPKPQEQYFPETSVLDTTNDQYMQATTVLDTAGDQYSQATTVLNTAGDQYSQATTVLNTAGDQYSQATTVLDTAGDQYGQATTVLDTAGDQYSQATTVLDTAGDQYGQATTVLGENNDIVNSFYNEYTQGTTVLSGDGMNASVPTASYEIPSIKKESDKPLGFRVVRKVSVTHCNEVL